MRPAGGEVRRILGSWRSGARLEGRAVNGLAEGAKTFFGRRFEELSWDEYLALLACLSAPDRTHPRVDPGESARQVEALKRQLAKRGIGPEGPSAPAEGSP